MRDALFIRGAVAMLSSAFFLQLSPSSGVLTPPPYSHIHPVASGNVKAEERTQEARQRFTKGESRLPNQGITSNWKRAADVT